jgi:hypothetical protein
MRETGTGQQVAQLHDRYMMMMTLFRIIFDYLSVVTITYFCLRMEIEGMLKKGIFFAVRICVNYLGLKV